MRYGLTLVTPPAAEAVALDEMKLWLRIDPTVTEDDGLIMAAIQGARDFLESRWDFQLAPATWLASYDSFPAMSSFAGGLAGAMVSSERPGESWLAQQPGQMGGRYLDALALRLPKQPLKAVTTLQYLDSNGAVQALAPNLYQVDTTRQPGRVAPAYGQAWPAVLPTLDAVLITFTAGMGFTTSIALAIAPGVQTVSPAAMAGIRVGGQVSVDVFRNQERVAVTAVTSTTFTATFIRAHVAGAVCSGGVPESLKTAVKMLAGWQYENREASPADLERVDDLCRMSWSGAT